MAFENVQIITTLNGINPVTGYREDLAIGDVVSAALTPSPGSITSVRWELGGRPAYSAAGGAGPEPIFLALAPVSSFVVDSDAGGVKRDGTYKLVATINPGTPSETRKTVILARLSGIVINIPGGGTRGLRKTAGFEELEDTKDPTIFQGYSTQENFWKEAIRQLWFGGSGTTTLADAYNHGSSSGDQTLNLRDARGGGILIDASNVGFTGASALRINSAAGGPVVVDRATGRVGIGTATPAKDLHVVATSPALRLERSGGAAIDVQNVTDELRFLNGATVLARVMPTGGVRSDFGLAVGTAPATNPVMSFGPGDGTPVSGGGEGRVRYNNGATQMEYSVNGGPWTPFAGAGSHYDFVQSAGVGVTQRNTLNFFGGLVAVDNGGSTRTDVSTLLTAARVAYGSGTNTMTSDARLSFTDTAGAPKLGLATTNAFNPSDIGNSGMLTLLREQAGLSQIVVASVFGSSSGGIIAMQKARGTRAAPTAHLSGDTFGFLSYLGHDGTNYFSPIANIAIATAAPSTGVMPAQWAVQVGDAGILPAPGETTYALKVDTSFNVYTGRPNLATTSTDGFLYPPGVAGVPTGVPSNAFSSTLAQNRVPTVIDTTDARYYAYIGGAWHYAEFRDGVATTATLTATQVGFGSATNTLTGSASFVYDSTNERATLNRNFNGGGVPLIVNNTHAAGAGIGIGIGFNIAGTRITTITHGTLTGGQNVFSIANGAGNAAVSIYQSDLDTVIARPASQLATSTTIGFVWYPQLQGAPSATPAHSGTDEPLQRATIVDETDRRYYAYLGGAWHYTAFDDGVAAAATLTATQVGFGSPGNLLTGDPTLAWDNTNKTLLVGANASAATGRLGSFAANVAGAVAVQVANLNNSAGNAIARFQVGNDVGGFMHMGISGSSNTAVGFQAANATWIFRNTTGGVAGELQIANLVNATGNDIVFYTNPSSTTEQLRIRREGDVRVASLAAGGLVAAAASTGQLAIAVNGTNVFYQVVANAGSALTSRGTLNFSGGLVAVDNSGAGRTDVTTTLTATQVGFGGGSNTMIGSGQLTYLDGLVPTLIVGDGTTSTNGHLILANTGSFANRVRFANGGTALGNIFAEINVSKDATAVTGRVIFQHNIVPVAGGSNNDYWSIHQNSTVNNPVHVYVVKYDVAIGSPTALATNATNGFVFLPRVTGAPTGVPDRLNIAAETIDRSPVVIDSTNKRWYYYDAAGAAWRYAEFNNGVASSTTLAATQVGFGSGGNLLTGSAQWTYADGTAPLITVGDGSTTTQVGLFFNVSASATLTNSIRMRRAGTTFFLLGSNIQGSPTAYALTNLRNVAQTTNGDDQVFVSGSTGNRGALMIYTGSGDVALGGSTDQGLALATNATFGFVYLPRMAGSPSGTPARLSTGAFPTTVGEREATVIDTTNKRWYWYDTGGSAWRYAEFNNGVSTTAVLASTQVGFGDGSNHLTGNAQLTFTQPAGNDWELNIGDGTTAVRARLNLNSTGALSSGFSFKQAGTNYAFWSLIQDTTAVTGLVSTDFVIVPVAGGSNNDVFRLRSNSAGSEGALAVYAVDEDVMIGGRVALATNATAGFVWLPKMSGVPSGTPTRTGAGAARDRQPLVIDTTDKRLYWYDTTGAAWHFTAFDDSTGGGGATLTATQVGFGSISNTLTGSTAFTWDGTKLAVGTTSPFSTTVGHFTRNNNGQADLVVQNNNGGGAAQTGIRATNGSGGAADSFLFIMFGSAYTPSGLLGASTGMLELEAPGNLLTSVYGAGDLIWSTTTSRNERMRITNAGKVNIADLSAGGYTKAAVTSGQLSVVSTIPAADITNLYYQQVASAGVVATQRTTLNFNAAFGVADNAGAGRTDVSLVVPTAGQVAVSDGTKLVGDANVTVDTTAHELAIGASGVQSWYRVTGSNFERARAQWGNSPVDGNPNTFFIQSEAGGLGTVRDLSISAGTAHVGMIGAQARMYAKDSNIRVAAYSDTGIEGLDLFTSFTRATATSMTLNAITFSAIQYFSGTTNVTTATGVNFIRIRQPEYNGLLTSPKTFTVGATVYIENSPFAHNGVNLTTGYALWVDDGATRLDGNLDVGQSSTGGYVTVNGAAAPSNASLVVGKISGSGRDHVQFFLSGDGTLDTPDNAYFDIFLGNQAIASSAFGILATQRIRNMTYSRSGGSPACTEATSLYIDGAPTLSSVAGVSYALHVAGGTTQFDGDAILAGAGKQLSFFGLSPSTRFTVGGSRGGNSALASLISCLTTYGLVIDGTTP